MKPKQQRIQLKIATRWRDAERKEPVYETVSAVVLNPIFAAHRASRYDLWTVTHRPTGFASGHAKALTDARKLADRLVREVPLKLWRFTDPNTVRGNVAFKNCWTIIRDFSVC